MILCKVDFVAILRVIFLKKDTDFLKKGISVSLNRFVGMTGFEPATTRPPDAYSNRAELHPAISFCGAKV